MKKLLLSTLAKGKKKIDRNESLDFAKDPE